MKIEIYSVADLVDKLSTGHGIRLYVVRQSSNHLLQMFGILELTRTYGREEL